MWLALGEANHLRCFRGKIPMFSSLLCWGPRSLALWLGVNSLVWRRDRRHCRCVCVGRMGRTVGDQD